MVKFASSIVLPIGIGILFLFSSCKTDKPEFADLHVQFCHDGPKIDTTFLSEDMIIFKNIDGTAPIYARNRFPYCDNMEVFVGTYPIGDTLTWHLRLVEPDGDPATFQLYFDEDGEPVLLTESVHFIKPGNWDFQVTKDYFHDHTVVMFGN